MSELLVTSPIRSPRQYTGGRDEGRRYTQGTRETPRSRRTTVAAHPDTQAQSRSACARIAEITYWQFYFRFFPGAIRSPQIVEFLKVLRRQTPGKLLTIWHRLRAHCSRMVRDYAEEKRGDIQLEFLPAYAPELNPTEYIGGYLKTHEIGNLCARHVGEVRDLASRRLRSMQRRPALVRAFWKQAELAF